MIKSCETCGGLYSTEQFETFAGSACPYGGKHKFFATDPLPDVARREQSERVSGDKGEARATLPARPSANADGLLHCPFCGSEAEFLFERFPEFFQGIRCKNIECEAEMKVGGGESSPRDSIRRWNKRAM